ncbi:hypothetical protein N9Q58_04140 [Polaribacter sp.]|nr:hypothetical protein [Polaribacter sp.]
MKNILKTISFLTIGALMISACSDNENFTGNSSLEFTPVNVTLTTSQSSYSFDENAIDSDDPTTNSVTITANIDEPQHVDAVISFTQTEGTTDGDDYSIGVIRIPAGATSASTSLEINKTGDIEGTETFNLSAAIQSNFKLANAFNLPITIENDYINDVLEFSTTWAGEYSFNQGASQTTVNFCSIDFDVLLFTASGAFVQSLGATLSCNETGEISGLPDGDYYLVINLYSNVLSNYLQTETVPITISYNQDFFDSGSFVNNSFNLFSPSGLTNAVATITKSGYNYTVTPL